MVNNTKMMIRDSSIANTCGVCANFSEKLLKMSSKLIGAGGMKKTDAENVPKNVDLKRIELPCTEFI